MYRVTYAEKWVFFKKLFDCRLHSPRSFQIELCEWFNSGMAKYSSRTKNIRVIRNGIEETKLHPFEYGTYIPWNFPLAIST